MTEPESDLLRSYFASERFQATADLERRIMRALSEHPQGRAPFALPSIRVPARLVTALGVVVLLVLFGIVPAAAAPWGLATLPRQVLGQVGAAPVVERLMPGQASASSSGCR